MQQGIGAVNFRKSSVFFTTVYASVIEASLTANFFERSLISEYIQTQAETHQLGTSSQSNIDR